MKKVLVLICIVALTNIPFSCVTDCGVDPMKSSITELYGMVGSHTSNGFTATKSTDFTQAVVLVTIGKVKYTKIAKSTKSNNFSFINTAFACSPIPPKLQKIESITISSEAPVYAQGREFSPDDQLNELFKIIGYSSIGNFIGRQNDSPWLFGDKGTSIEFQLKDQPDSTINQTFTFEIAFFDATVLTTTSGALEVGN